ncbi:MAG TPA: glycogen debranching N-terminal domain-containing protein [Acidimicrobiales bacterium]|nr:glycogen debranching N-terminal domain-containing protein [Acidimicrobiales bacterium]
MPEAWSFPGTPTVSGLTGGTVTLVEGTSFCISQTNGDIEPGTAQGLFYRDTRFLSTWRLSIDEACPQGLSVVNEEPFAATFLNRARPRAGRADSTILVLRRRFVGNGMREDLVLRNLALEPAACSVTLEVDADFAHIFEVKEDRVSLRGERSVEVGSGELSFSYEWMDTRRGLRVSMHGDSVTAGPRVLAARVVVPARGEWHTCIQVEPSMGEGAVEPRYRCGQPVEATGPVERLRQWRRATPWVRTSHEGLAGAAATSEEDLGALRIFDPDYPERAVVAAGAPWFMTLFGRDSLITSWMSLPVDPSLAVGTLQTLARFQGERSDPLSEEEPGRILHEMRWGLGNAIAPQSGDIYYGTADATPLFVMLLGELRRWGLESAVVEELLPHADRALDWIEHHGDRDGDGFVEYQRATDRGLVNQGWKDSWDGINFASGRLADAPIALCEVQGYVYAAYVARSHFAWEAGDTRTAEHFVARAQRLKEAFNRAFWLDEKGYFAVGLDREKAPIDSLTSNIGHCLWTGIVDEDKAARVVERLMAPDMFSGWGVRTLSSEMGAYNPMSYHNGSVWPHDNALIAAGLMRYGYVTEAQRIVLGLLDAAACFQGRLPELFCGFGRHEFARPVGYPTSCSPQAWAAATPFSLLRTLLRLEPWVPHGRLWLAPAIPPEIGDLAVENVPLAGARLSIAVINGRTSVEDLPDSIKLIEEPRHPLGDPPTSL